MVRPSRAEIEAVITDAIAEATQYLAGVDGRAARAPNAEAVARAFDEAFPEDGHGAVNALRRLAGGLDGAAHSAGSRFFHFVIGGTTPAALGADWLTTALDQCAYAWVSSPLALSLELLSLGWLKTLLGLPSSMTGVMVSGATMANVVGLTAARQWWGERHGVDIGTDGLQGLPQAPVFSSGYVHASARKAIGMLGMGRSSVRTFSRDAVGRLDVDALRTELERLRGAPAILIGNAGEVNAGDFDPIDTMAELAETHGAWLHVDGAFGLFARVSPRTAHLAAGAERADSITVDGHKWLNVPYDCGFAFVRDRGVMERSFTYSGAYLPDADAGPNMGSIGPESSRRARSLAVWATLYAYGRSGYRDLIESHLDLAQRLADRVDAASDLERLAEVPLNIVCFRYNPRGLSEERLNALNRRLGEELLADGRVYAGTTTQGGKVALRPAIASWRIRPEDVDALVDVVRELGARCHTCTGSDER